MRYTVILKNPSCPSSVIEADGYEWEAARLVFRRKARTGETLRCGDGFSLEPVAEFAVDWVAGVLTETAKAD